MSVQRASGVTRGIVSRTVWSQPAAVVAAGLHHPAHRSGRVGPAASISTIERTDAGNTSVLALDRAIHAPDRAGSEGRQSLAIFRVLRYPNPEWLGKLVCDPVKTRRRA